MTDTTFSGAHISDIVYVRSHEYVVVGVGPASTMPKFWGKRKFVLRKSGTQDLFFGYAKHITYNMVLKPHTGEIEGKRRA